MAGPSYVAKKIGDQYVVVPKEPTATRAGRAWLGAGGLLVLLGALRGGGRGWLSTLLGAALIYRGVTGCSIVQMLLHPRRHERDARDGSRMSPVPERHEAGEADAAG